ncbi:cupin domain-containing protein [Proteiniborus sp. MB09-C3]|uniref:cupin domain-containing protein n=1 Tax=Proteiniborus sp. MB09-C3 TaxID=3050072 RepID=UPI002554720C|nr:cupin domain-containing protein [Proteiniborus sp. MB09-C3]WIV13438.1 cupin domain-containing protein [Proteiniborus sp. MB09-C3]
MTNYNADYYIEKLGLQPHYEGGWYKFIWKTDKEIPKSILGNAYSGDRPSATVIFYLLKAGETSAWHKLRSAEIWFWHAGGSLKMILGGSGKLPNKEKEIILGNKIDKGQQFQAIVPADVWQTSTPCVGEDFVLVSCVVSPGFHVDEFLFPEK